MVVEVIDFDTVVEAKDFIRDTKRKMVRALVLCDMSAFTKLKSNLKEAKVELKGLKWLEGAEAYYAGL